MCIRNNMPFGECQENDSDHTIHKHVLFQSVTDAQLLLHHHVEVHLSVMTANQFQLSHVTKTYLYI